MRTVACQIPLRNAPKRQGASVILCEFGWSSTYSSKRFLLVLWSFCVMMKIRHHEGFSVFLDMGRYKNWANKIGSWKYLTIWKTLLSVIPQAQSASFLLSTLNCFRGLFKVSSCCSTWFNPCRSRWQVPIISWQIQIGSTLVHTNLTLSEGTLKVKSWQSMAPSII